MNNTPPGRYPSVRLRRPRQADWSRRLVAETRLSVNDLIWAIIVKEGENSARACRGDAGRLPAFPGPGGGSGENSA